MMRFTDSAASTVWIVESTRWPVSAADSAVRTVLVAHLADQDHVRVLAQDAAQRAGERGGVLADLALVDDRVLSRWRNSTGSSIVTMLPRSSR